MRSQSLMVPLITSCGTIHYRHHHFAGFGGNRLADLFHFFIRQRQHAAMVEGFISQARCMACARMDTTSAALSRGTFIGWFSGLSVYWF